MTVEELAKKLTAGTQMLQILDVRSPQERSFARIEPSLFVPLYELSARMDELSDLQDKIVVVYCHHGVRSAYAANFLVQAGFTDVHNLEGGIDAWSLQIDPEVPRY